MDPDSFKKLGEAAAELLDELGVRHILHVPRPPDERVQVPTYTSLSTCQGC